VVKDICRQTRRHFSAEDKIRIVLEGLHGDDCSYAGARGKSPLNSRFWDGGEAHEHRHIYSARIAELAVLHEKTSSKANMPPKASGRIGLGTKVGIRRMALSRFQLA
jgi:transposase-like protein